MILAIRTEKPEAELFLYKDGEEIAKKIWQAHRELGTTIHMSVKYLLDSTGADWKDITGIIFYEGPGSFTGLRIGASVANALVASNQISVSNQSGEDWVKKGLRALSEKPEATALPKYGSDPHVTAPKK